MAFGIVLLSKLYSIKASGMGIPETEFGCFFNVFTLSISLMCLIKVLAQVRPVDHGRGVYTPWTPTRHCSPISSGCS